jgi:hypothetical protein
MSNNQKEIHLTAEEADYLSTLMSDESFISFLENHKDIRVNFRTVLLNRTEAKMLRSYFSSRLARVGFDADYKPNKEGILLESLIERFFSLVR